MASILLIVLVFATIIAVKIAKYLAAPGITDLMKALGIGILFFLLIFALIKNFKARHELKQTAGFYQNEFEKSQKKKKKKKKKKIILRKKMIWNIINHIKKLKMI